MAASTNRALNMRPLSHRSRIRTKTLAKSVRLPSQRGRTLPSCNEAGALRGLTAISVPGIIEFSICSSRRSIPCLPDVCAQTFFNDLGEHRPCASAPTETVIHYEKHDGCTDCAHKCRTEIRRIKKAASPASLHRLERIVAPLPVLSDIGLPIRPALLVKRLKALR